MILRVKYLLGMFGCRFDIRVSLTVLSVAVPVVGMTVLWCMLPAHSDDLWYDQGVRDFMAAGQSRLQALLSEMQVHAETDNLRFANVAYLLCSCVPRWVTAVLLGFCMAWGLWGLVKLSGGGIQTPLRASMLSAAYVYVLPWMAFPFSHDFALNYVPSVALCAWTAWLFCRPRTLTLRARIGAVVLALLTAFWHEEAAVPLIVAFPMYMIVSADRARWRILMWLALLPGLIYHVCMPGFWYRLSIMGTGEGGIHLKSAFLLTLLLGAVAVWACCKSCRKGKCGYDEGVVCLCASAGIGSLGLALTVSGNERAMVCGMTLCIAGWLRVSGMLLGRSLRSLMRTSSVWLAAVLVCVLTWHFAVVVAESRAMLVKYDRALERYVESGDLWIYCDLDYGEERPCLWRECRPGRQFLKPGYVQERLSLWWRGEDRFCIFYDEKEKEREE